MLALTSVLGIFNVIDIRSKAFRSDLWTIRFDHEQEHCLIRVLYVHRKKSFDLIHD
jgi:hypothetical protein